MITYFLNCMGPVNREWTSKNGTDWRGGRIDIEDGSPFGREYTTPIMKDDSWYKLSDWLDNTATETILPFAELIQMFEEQCGVTIEWFEPPSDWILDQEVKELWEPAAVQLPE